MPMENVSLSVPKNFVPYLTVKTPEQEFVRNAMILYPYIQDCTISHGRAAEILGVSKIALIALYSKLGFSYLDMTDDEFDEEVQTVKSLEK